MTRWTFPRIVFFALCVVILLGVALYRPLNVLHERKIERIDAMLREYYGDELEYRADTFYYVPYYATMDSNRLPGKNRIRKLKNYFKPAETSEFTMTMPASVRTDDVITVSFTSTRRHSHVYKSFYIERKFEGGMYTLNHNKRDHSTAAIPADGTLELTFPLEDKYPPGEYRLVAHVHAEGIAPADNFFLAAEFTIE